MTAQVNKPGYKHTPLGWMPEEWDIMELRDLVNPKRGIRYGIVQPGQYDPNGRYMVRGQDYSFGWVGPDNLFRVSDEIESKYKNARIKKGDIILTIVGAGTGTVAIVPDWLDGANITQTTARIAVESQQIERDFCYQFLVSDFGKKLTYTNIKGGAQPGLNCGDIEQYIIPVPPLPEQRAIAAVLSTWDKAIEKTSQLIAQKEKRKKWLMQQLLTGMKRLKGFSGTVEHHILKPFIKEISERNKETRITTVLSVTNSKGFVSQEEHFDRIVASNDLSNYKIVCRGQFAYNPSRVNVGSLDLLRTFENGILSPMYVVFETRREKLLPEFLFYHLKSNAFYDRIPMFVQGSVRDSLSFEGLTGMRFFIPSVDEQTAITSILQAADKEIQLLNDKLEKLKEQKKGLMQVLLTGKVRMKVKS